MCALRRHPSALDNPKLSVVIPVYNEKNTIEEILRRVSETGMRVEIVIVDDCSTDGTRQYLEGMKQAQEKGETHMPAHDGGDPVDVRDLRIFFQTRNQGKGAAMRRGFAEASGDIVLVQDADLEYDPKDYPTLLEPIIDGRADVVFGSRFLVGAAASALFLALRGEPNADAAVGRDDQFEADGHGDVLQSVSEGSAARDHAEIEPVWIRAGNYGENCQGQVADL